MTITRIIMDKEVDTPGKMFVAGQVYDSRFPADAPVFIAQHDLDFFIAQGWAHEQTWDEWFGQLGKNRKANIAACVDSARKAELIAADNLHSAQDAIINGFMHQEAANA